ncbi:hypothetical protein BDW02DRAFT_574020 [Decorospora gaudefroyi]|uniref:Uncharacterized protein n=1 Tax=Decorospora gaudefroyi TaxID=184978 RepID=A0A6A5JYH5_9PLEO|nr:hypothetical protein BDW02DRAFT_574020 [Decorospora gaudefroyi]
MAWLPSIFNRTSTAPMSQTLTVQGKRSPHKSFECRIGADAHGEEDPDWSDIDSDEHDTGAGSDDDGRPRDGSSVYLEEELMLLPYMPTLFSNDLPPCGPIPQLAYENTVRRLRKIWLQRANQSLVDIPILGICTWVLEDLEAEAEECPIDSQLCTKARTPWRREKVFKYEIRWARYFVREAKRFENKSTMTEQERDEQEFMDLLFLVPKELRIYIQDKANRKWVMDLWKEWHIKKRGTAPQNGSGLDAGGVKEKNEERKEDDARNEKGRVDGPAMLSNEPGSVEGDWEMTA